MLRDLLKRESNKQIFTGWSGAETFYLPAMEAYLKIAPVGDLADLSREKEVLEWLDGKLSVPRVIEFEDTGEEQLLLISEIKGMPASEYITGLNDHAAIRSFVKTSAGAVRMIHDLRTDDCPLRQDIDIKLVKAGQNVRRGLVDESDFEEDNQGRTGGQIYEELVKKKPRIEDRVFTHGDLCLPNYIMLDGVVSGFIDFDRGGIADRYQDIALFLRSFDLNTEAAIDIEETFCRAYGIDSLDREKIYYYRLLDELF